MLNNSFMRKNRKTVYLVIIAVLLVGITLGSALLNSTLNIIGSSEVKKNNWIIYFDDIDIAEDSAPVDNSNDNARFAKNGVEDTTKKNIEFTASLKNPGDFYEFTVWTVNDGTMDAAVESLEKSTLTLEQQKYLEYEVTYDDGTPIEQCDILYHKDSLEGPNKKLIKATVKYKPGLNVNEYPTEGVTLNLSFKINYSQNTSCEHTTPESTYRLTINPNGGKFEGRTAQTRKYLKEDDEYLLVKPKKELYDFDGWDIVEPTTGGTYHLEPSEDKYLFTMGHENVVIKAKWKDGGYVARIMDHYYTSIEDAFAAVDGVNPDTGTSWSDNTVYLIKDTDEVVLNSARSNFIFNLDGHTLTGKIVNPSTGKLTVVNGTIQGSTTVEENDRQRRIDEGITPVPSINGVTGEGILNYGILNLGINDRSVDADNIIVKGDKYSIYNVENSKFNFYDGTIKSSDAISGLIENYTAGDMKVEPHYYTFVDHVEEDGKEEQKIYLTSSLNKAVVKTTTVIDVYYYNLMDAIKTVTSVKKKNNSLTDNDYIIQTLRTFDATYNLSTENNSRVFIDLKGYSIQVNEDLTNNGYLKLYNSTNNDSELKLVKSATNNGSLDISNINIPISTDDPEIINGGTLKLTDVIMNSHGGYCVKNIENGTLDFNQNVILKSVHKNDNPTTLDTSDNYALYNNGTNASLNGGTIYGLYNEGTITLDGDNLNLVTYKKYTSNDSEEYIKAIYNKGTIIMDDGTITSDKDTSMVLNEGTFTLNDGLISSEYTAVDNSQGTLNIKGGEVVSDRTAIINGTVNVDGGTVRTSSTNGITDSTVNVKSGSVIALDGSAIGSNCTANIIGGTVTGTSVAIDTTTVNVSGGTVSAPVAINSTNTSISGGTINGTTNGVITDTITMNGGIINSSEGIGLTVKTEGTITGGEVYGATYGVLNKNTLTLGSDDGSITSLSPVLEGQLFGLYIEGDNTNFYDGILKGQNDGYYGTITGTPLGGVIGEGVENREDNVVYQTDFVTEFEGWLRIGDTRYNSLNDASDAVEENNEATIIVTKDADIKFAQEFIDNNKNKNITLDLNGHKITTTQNIINNTNLTIIDTNSYPDTGNKPGTIKVVKGDGIVNLAKIVINGGRYESTSEQVFLNKASDTDNFSLGIEINSAVFNVTNTTVKNGTYENNASYEGYLKVNGITIESALNGIDNTKGTLIINGTKDNTTGEYTTNITGTSIGIKNEDTLIINGGNISSNGKGISGTENNITVNETKNINLEDDNQVASTKITSSDISIESYGKDITINGGTITSTNNTAIVGHNSITVNNGNIKGTRGIKNEEWCNYSTCEYKPITINGGTIIGIQNEGIYSNYTLTVTGGYILGQIDGIYSKGIATVGTKGGTLSTESPEIRGVNGYGFNNDNGEFYFYDGILKGKRKTGFDYSAHNGLITTVEDVTQIKRDYEYINSVYYETEYLIPQGDWLEIVGKGRYNTIDSACSAASNGDTIRVIADTQVGYKQACNGNKTLIFDLQNYSVSFTETVTINSNITFKGTGSINNLRTDTLILNGETTILSGNYTSLGGVVLTNKNKLTIKGGTFESTDKNTIVNDGTLVYNGNKNTSYIKSRDNYAVLNNDTFTLNNGSILSNGGVDNKGTFTMINGKVEGLEKYSIISSDGTVDIKGGEVVNNYNTSMVLTCSANATVEGNSKISSTYGSAINNTGNTSDTCNGTNLYIKGGEVLGKTNGIANSNSSYLEVSGGHILGEDNNGISINNTNTKILSGIIEGGVYGIYTTQDTDKEVRIGENDSNVLIDVPVIKGQSYGLYINDGIVNFYDGILKGQVEGYYGDITHIADNTELYRDSETINDIDYNTVYLLVEGMIARNISKPNGELAYTEYDNLQDAFDEASDGDKIILISDAPLYYELTNTKNIELDMKGYTISTNKKIINDGELVIKNTSSEVSVIKTSAPLELITNNNTLSIDNISIKNTSTSNYVVKNDGTLSLNNTQINSINGIENSNDLTIVDGSILASKTAINNSGKLTISNGTYQGTNYSIYSDSTMSTTISNSILEGTYYNAGVNESSIDTSRIISELQNIDSAITITNTELDDTIVNNGTMTINGSVYNGKVGNIISNNSTMNILNSSINLLSSNVVDFAGITNNGTLNITSTNINHDESKVEFTSVNTILNNGTLNIDGTTRIVLGNEEETSGTYIGIKSIGESVTNIDLEKVMVNRQLVEVPNIEVKGANTNYGIYIDESANVTLKSGYIKAYDALNTYGVYINNGIYTQGIYDGSGLESADVSKENPKVYSMGTTLGVGVKKVDGEFNFYDGIIYATKYSKPETPTAVEKNYEANTYIDNNSGYEYSWLEYVEENNVGNDYVACIIRDFNTDNYESVTEALEHANPGDVIILLKSTTESIVVDQNKIVSIDLNGRSLTGKVTNNGILTVYNGSIQNFEDTTVINNGELVMGQLSDPISTTSIRIISDVKAIEQNGTFAMYDGYIEGSPAISGEINEIAPFSRLQKEKDNQREKIYLLALDEESIRNRQTALLLTIDPDYGYYDGRNEKFTVEKYYGDVVKVKEVVKNGCIFLGWETTGDITLIPIEEGTDDYRDGYRYQFTVGVKDMTLTAKWELEPESVAKIGEVYFESVAAAFTAANAGDKIELLKDVVEPNLVNTKEVTLDLCGYKLTTNLENTGILTVINGTIENTNGTAILNKKTLIIGENDENEPSYDSIKVIGTDIGIKNEGGLRFYDGYIEGYVALAGDVEAVPQGYYLYIEHNNEKDCQREYLIKNPNNAVAMIKSDSGSERTAQYFFRLQDAIETASITGKEIFVIKTVPGTYPMSVRENKNIVINLNGNDINMGNDFVNNGTLTLYDTSVDREHGEYVCSQPLVNNGTLYIKDINLSQTKSSNVINNNGTLDLKNTTITALDGYAVKDNGTLIFDSNTSILGNKYSLYLNEANDYTIDKGTFSGIYTDSNITFNGNVSINQTSASDACVYVNNPNIDIVVDNINCTSEGNGIILAGISDTLDYNDGTISTKKASIWANKYYHNVTIDGGTISSLNSYAFDIESSNSDKRNTATINDGNMSGKYGIYYTYTNLVQNGGKISSTTGTVVSGGGSGKYILNNGYLYSSSENGVATYSDFIMNDGKIEVSGEKSRGIIAKNNITINGGSIIATGQSSAGIYSDGSSAYVIMNGGSIYSANIGINIYIESWINNEKEYYIYGGSIFGDNYGINLTNAKAAVYIGNKDQEFNFEDAESVDEFENNPLISGGLYGIYRINGTAYFYNGRLRGTTGGYNYDFADIRAGKDIYDGFEVNPDSITAKTFSTTSVSNTAISNTAKTGNGYARITYIDETNELCTNGDATDFDYTGDERTFTASCTGKYKLEVWGAGTPMTYSNSNYAQTGKGGYSTGEINLTSGETLYINVGGQGSTVSGTDASVDGGYNGGGKAIVFWTISSYSTSGGGATHIATQSGLLSTLENNKSSVLIVAGGAGGGAYYASSYYGFGGSGGGYIGNNGTTRGTHYGTGGTQTSGGYYTHNAQTGKGSFGQGGQTTGGNGDRIYGGAGGGGWYGGGAAGSNNTNAGGGGSGYVGNARLSNAYMYGYNVQTPIEGWKVNYLIQRKSFLRIEGRGEYASFNDADDDIDENETVEIDVFEDSVISEESILSSNKNITLDLNGHTVKFMSPIYNYSNLTIIDSSLNKTGKLVNVSTDVIITEGNITFNSGTIRTTSSGKYGIVVNAENIELHLNSGAKFTGVSGIRIDKQLVSVYEDGADFNLGGYIIYTSALKSNITINSGNLVTSGASGIYYSSIISNVTNNGILNLNGGYIKASKYAVNASNVNIIMKDGTLTNTDSSNNAKTYGTVLIYYYSSLIMDGGTINSPNGSALSISNTSSTIEINDGTISSNKYYGFHVSGGAPIINGGTFTANSSNSYSAAVCVSGGSPVINGGTFISDYYGIYATGDSTFNLKINGGTVVGNTYGIYSSSANSTINIGNKNQNNDINNPIITGNIGVYKTSGTINYYGGRLRGKNKSYDIDFNLMRSGMNVHNEDEVVTENDTQVTYKISYLVEREGFIQVDSDEEHLYNTFDEALTHIPSGGSGTLKVRSSLSYNEEITFPEDKNITLDLYNNTLEFSKPIVNNTNLTVIDSSEDKKGFLNNVLTNVFQNNGNISVTNVKLKSPTYAILANSGTGTITLGSGATINGTSGINIVADQNLLIDGATIDVTGTGVYIESYVANVTIESGYIKANNGINCYNSYSSNKRRTLLINGGTIEGTNIAVSLYATNASLKDGTINNIGSSKASYAVYLNSLTVLNIDDGTINGNNSAAIYIHNSNNELTINGGKVESDNDTIKIRYGKFTLNDGIISTSGLIGAAINITGGCTANILGGTIISDNAYGIKDEAGNDNKTINIYGGNISGYIYGIYVGDTLTTLNIGNINEDNSTTMPKIEGTLYGIYKANGIVNFYSGRIEGGTSSMYGMFSNIRDEYELFEEYLDDEKISSYRTYSINEYNSEAISDTAKDGNGHARITYIDETSGDCIKDTVYDYVYKGAEDTFTVTCPGKYKLEVWGASGGGEYKGYGGYSTGEILLTSGEILYVNVGGQGLKTTGTSGALGGYNGGGSGGEAHDYSFKGGNGGGGATHIATSSGILSTLENNKSSVIIVAGGGGGSPSGSSLQSGHAGGAFANDGEITSRTYLTSVGATQLSGYAFGQGADGPDGVYYSYAGWGGTGSGGSGGGWYGGYGNFTNKNVDIYYTLYVAGAGGSGYIGSTRLSNKYMIGYNVKEVYPSGNVIATYLRLPEELVENLTTHVRYKNLQDAFDYASDNDILQLVRDIDISYELEVKNAKVVLDLNGFNLKTNRMITLNNELEIRNDNTGTNSKLSNNLSTYLFENNSKLTISEVDFEGKKLIKNNEGSTLIISDSTITCSTTAIENIGTYTISNATITGDTYGLYDRSTGTSNSVTNSSISANTYALYVNGSGTNNFVDTDFSGQITNNSTDGTINISKQNKDNIAMDDFINNKGTLSISNAIMHVLPKSSNNETVINNSGILTIINSTVTYNDIRYRNNYNRIIVKNTGTLISRGNKYNGIGLVSAATKYGYHYCINNSSVMESTNDTFNINNVSQAFPIVNNTSNDSIINNATITIHDISEYDYAITDTTGKLTINIANIEMYNDVNSIGIKLGSSTSNVIADNITINMHDNSTLANGIYIENGSLNLSSGSIDVDGNTAYGVYMLAGNYLQGVNENTGEVTNNTSLTDPHVSAIGTTKGIGISMGEGKFSFFDGYIHGSTSAFDTGDLIYLTELRFHEKYSDDGKTCTLEYDM